MSSSQSQGTARNRERHLNVGLVMPVMWGWELNSGSLEEQCSLSATESAVQPCILCFLVCRMYFTCPGCANVGTSHNMVDAILNFF